MNNPTPETRRLVLTRDAYKCFRCGTSILGKRYSIHHRRLRSHTFPKLHEPANLITLCGSGTQDCHRWVHDHPKLARHYGWIVSAYHDHPEQVPVKNHRHGYLLLDNEGHATPAPSNNDQ